MSISNNESIENQRASISQNVKIEVFTSPTCPHCPHAKKAVEKFAAGRENIKIVETSTASREGQRRAETFGIRSVPTLFITGPGTADRIGYAGVPSEKGLSKMVNIALGKENWEEEQGFLEKIKNIFGGKQDVKS
ncbi:MAG: thioredoxin family protein [archaeon]